MRETIVFAPEIKENEMIKNLALHGVRCFNLRICNDIQLAQLVLMRNGIYEKQQPISTMEENAIMLRALECTDYFGKATFSDVQEIAAAVRNMRMLVVDENEETAIKSVLEKGEFKEKNEALYKVYSAYLSILEDEDLIDRIGIIRNALKKCSPLDSDFYILEGSVLNPVQKALIHRASDGRVKMLTLGELYNIDGAAGSESKIEIQDIKNCYGMANEVETVLQEIYEGKKLDTCTVAVTDYNSYCQLFYDYSIHHNIPISFGKGIPIINSSPATLLRMYYHWMTDAFFDAVSVTNMIKSRAFNKSKLKEAFGELPDDFSWNRFLKVLGAIRLTNDISVNEKRIYDFENAITNEDVPENDKEYRNIQFKKNCVPYLKIMANELALPVEEFVSKYASIRWKENKDADDTYEKLDMAAIRVIYNGMKAITSVNDAQSVGDVIQSVLQKNICTSSAKAGAIYLTDISGAISCMRDNLFIVGLSASNYPGKPRENYLLLDADIKCFGDGANYLLSAERVKNKSSRLMRLARFAAKLNSKLYVSYAGLNVSDLKNDNASSMVYELYKESNGGNVSSDEIEKNTKTIGYFEPRISDTRHIGHAYNEGDNIMNAVISHSDGVEDLSKCLDKEYSPSALADYVKCPRLFALKHLLGVSDTTSSSAFRVASSLDTGNMMHTLMQKIANKKVSENTFVAMAADVFDRFIMEHPPIINQSIDSEKKQFMDMARIAYQGRPTGKVIMQENEISCVHESGIKLYGYPDCIEQLADGSLRVIDYKTNRTVVHVENDVDSCIQLLVYASILEKMGYRVSCGEFRYLRLGETIGCEYNNTIKTVFDAKIEEFHNYLENIATKVSEINVTDACDACNLAGICKRN